jgi:tetratricopeptide (TPR) repeat protein
MMLKRYLIHIILFNTACYTVFEARAQSSDDAFYLAQNYYVEANYDQAILEAKRAAFFRDSLRLPVSLFLSDCYEKKEMYDEAIHQLSIATEYVSNDSLTYELVFKKINLYLRSKQPAYALIELSQLHCNNSVYFSTRRNLYFAMAYFQIGDFNNSKKYSEKVLEGCSDYDSCFINKFFLRATKNSSRSALIPALSSAIIPGSGQLMNGYYHDAANSFALHAVLAAVTYVSFVRLKPLDAIITMFPFVHRYYLSNIFIARDMAISKREKVNIEMYNELLDYIDNVLTNQNSEPLTSLP